MVASDAIYQPWCQYCGRPLFSIRSIVREHGPTCWKRYINSLPESERFDAAMTGYTCKELGDGFHVVLSPEGAEYEVGLFPPSCACPAWGRDGKPCKHWVFVVSLLDVESPAFMEQYERKALNPAPVLTDEDRKRIEREMLTDFVA